MLNIYAGMVKRHNVCKYYVAILVSTFKQAERTIFLHAGPSEAVRHGGGRRTKNLQGEREREKEEKGGKKRKEEKNRKGEESKRERCIRPIGVKHALSTVKRL